MFCHNCGKKLEDGVKHCPYCGAKQSSEVSGKTDNIEARAGEKKTGKSRLPFLAAGAVLLVVIILLAVKLLGGGYTLKPTDYVELRLTGLNTEGKATISFDTKRLLEDIQKNKKLTEREQEVIELLVSDVSKDFSMSKNEQLSNGDEITVESNLDKKLLKEYGVLFKNGSVKLTVENLLDIREISLNDYLSFEFYGFEGNGYGYPALDWNGLRADAEAKIREADTSQKAEKFISEELNTYLSSITMEPYSMEGLSNGEEVTAVISMENTEITEYGVRFVCQDLSGEVEGLVPTEEIILSDYLTGEFEGFDGRGEADVTLDRESLTADLKTLFSKNERGAYGVLAENADMDQEASNAAESIVDAWRYSFTTEISRDYQLSEGDELTVECGAENEPVYLSSVGIYLYGGTRKMTVEGLYPAGTISLTDYLDCSFEGYNGAGQALVRLNEEQLLADIREFLEKHQRGAYGELQEDTDIDTEATDVLNTVKDFWRYSFTTELDRSEGLANENTVTLSCAALEEADTYISYMGIQLEGGTKEIQVAGLQIPQKIDLTEALNVQFSGICPEVYVERFVDYDVPYFYLTSLGDMDYNEEIHAWNGDTYSGEISYDPQEMLENGYVVINNHYSYKVSGLNSYRLSVDTLDDENLQKIAEDMKTLAVSRIMDNREWLRENLNSDEKWIVWADSSVELYSGQIAQVSNEYGTQNRIYLVLRDMLPVKKLDHSVVQKEVYFVSCCYNVKETPDGSLLYEDYSTSLFMNEAEVTEYIRSDQEDMGENLEITSLEWSGEKEETAIALNGDEMIRGEAIQEEMLQPAELAGNAANLAAALISYEGHTYARYDMNLPWSLAKDFCETAGGHLATITSSRENAVIQYLLKDASFDRYWLGGTDADWEGGWRWITGEPFAWTDWDSGQPDNDSGNDEGEENYLEIGSRFDGCWNDLYGSSMAGGFILEMEPDAEKTGDQEEKQDSDGSGRMAYLTDLTASYNWESGLQNQVQDPYGEQHFYSLYLNASERAVAYYELDGAWSELTGNISTWTEADSDGIYEILIWGDNEPLFSLYDYRKTDAPVSFRLNVEGVETLSIQTRNRGAESNGYLFLNECKLWSDGSETGLTETKKSLTDLKLIDSTQYSNYQDKGLPTDSKGTVYRELNQFCASENGQAVWKLNGSYQSLEGVLFVGEASYNEETAVSMEILADGEQIFLAENLNVFQGILPVSADLTGKDTLTIRTWTSEENGNMYIYLGNTVLTGVREEETKAAVEPEFAELDPSISENAAKTVTMGNYRYYRFDEPFTRSQAEAFCRAAGGTLARPDNEQKNAALKLLVNDGCCSSYWVDGQREISSSGLNGTDSREGWKWSDGTPFGEYQNWSGSQPDNYEGKEYLLCMYQNGTWNDEAGQTKMGFVLELPAVSGQIAEEDENLAELEWTDSQNCQVEDGYTKEMFYPSAVRMDASNNARFSIALNGAYAVFQGRIHPYRQASEDANFQFGIFGDGKLLYEVKDMKKYDNDVMFSVDVTGVEQLTIAACNNGGYSNGFLYLLGGHFSTDPDGEKKNISRLGDLIAVDAVESSSDNVPFLDVYGELHDCRTALNAGSGSDILYNLGGKYTSFTGSFTSGTDTLLGAPSKITFYADGTAVYEIEALEKSKGTVPFEIDVTGVNTLEIRAEAETEGKSSWIYLVDDQLMGV